MSWSDEAGYHDHIDSLLDAGEYVSSGSYRRKKIDHVHVTEDGEKIYSWDDRWEEYERRRLERNRAYEEEREREREARREEREKKEREWIEQHWRKHTVGMTDEEKAEFERSLLWILIQRDMYQDLYGEPF